ncbi:TIGR03862 family flavoprotein [Phenylobacterium aquaticum]|uniref:NAD(P)/FAD-dependent oxidoreductase n=1 Tax=Phenylobacterium aquaticum TaxID=1763816 RepID=UPI0026F324F8|nr:TIGR03862 family flavoprotein [Phenylobacterium aquaticum]
MTQAPHLVVIGAGPAGLIAAEHLAQAGWRVTVHDRMPSVGRKLLMAGRGGLNLTHSEPAEPFLARYGAASPWLAPMLRAFSAADLTRWAEGLGQQTFTGPSGRVFPKAMKASPLLRAWLIRLSELGVEIRTRSEWRGWAPAGDLVFADVEGATETVQPDATLLALGGASWPRLGSDGGWTQVLTEAGVAVSPLKPANCGFEVDWSPIFRDRFAGQPLKAVALSHRGQAARGDAMVTAYGLEGGAVYALSGALRDAIAADGPQTLEIDLRPDLSRGGITDRLAQARPSLSTTELLRKALKLTPAAINLVREGHGPGLTPERLAAAVKAVPIRVTAARPLDRAISSAGGISRDAVDEGLMLKARPGVWAAGEMLDWEAPTGGYLLQACFATGLWAAKAMAASHL